MGIEQIFAADSLSALRTYTTVANRIANMCGEQAENDYFNKEALRSAVEVLRSRASEHNKLYVELRHGICENYVEQVRAEIDRAHGIYAKQLADMEAAGQLDTSGLASMQLADSLYYQAARDQQKVFTKNIFSDTPEHKPDGEIDYYDMQDRCSPRAFAGAECRGAEYSGDNIMGDFVASTQALDMLLEAMISASCDPVEFTPCQ